LLRMSQFLLRTSLCLLGGATSYSKPEMSKHSDAFHFWNCHLCDKAFSDKPSLVGHINTVHPKMSSYNCELSDFSLEQRSHVVTHSKTVHVVFSGRNTCCENFCPSFF
jgi:hypothetical protein